ncbi:VWA domain-containing protein [Myxococcota bacterium]|nr:VWA domain-containing protein [Myxococcota bacterium]
MRTRILAPSSLLLALLACDGPGARDDDAHGAQGDGGASDGGSTGGGSGDGGDGGGWTSDGGSGWTSDGGAGDGGSSDGGTDGDGGAGDTGDPDDTGTPDEEDCLDEEVVPLWLSPDDSNSMSSPVQVRDAVLHGSGGIRYVPVRPWEFFNYATWDYPAAAAGELVLHAAIVPTGVPDTWRLQLGLASETVDLDDRDPMNLVFSVDTSGSMSGEPIELVRRSLLEIAGHLRPGDVVSMVTWDTSHTVRMANHTIVDPSDETLLAAISSLEAGGGTDLNRGLSEGYELALVSYDPSMTNRVILLSDGGANAGITDIELIAAHAGEEGDDGVYLVGVGVGEGIGYNDDLMDDVTDAGKGASVFIPDEDEIGRIFGDRFLSTLEVAAREVEVELTLPPGFEIVRFSGEELSTDRAEVEPQNIAPNDAMVFHHVIRRCEPVTPDDDSPIAVTAHYRDAVTWERKTAHLDTTWGALVAADRAPVDKGAAILAATDALRAARGEPIGMTEAEALALAHDALDAAAVTNPGDGDLEELRRILSAL